MIRITVLFCLLSVSFCLPQTDLRTIFIQPKGRSKNMLSNKSIINGNDASPHQFPYQVGIFIKNPVRTDFCGGSLISPNFVLTAAHCLDKAFQVTLVFGAHNVTANESSQVKQVSKRFIVHENWDSNAFNKNDIALIKLQSPIQETLAIKIIKFATGSKTYEKQSGIVTGWGVTHNSQTGVTPILKYLTTTIISNNACKKVDTDYDSIILDTLLCISGEGYKATCLGDSGGPLVVDGVQVGVVSFGAEDCEAGKPSVFTRLTKYRDWIVKNSDVKL